MAMQLSGLFHNRIAIRFAALITTLTVMRMEIPFVRFVYIPTIVVYSMYVLTIIYATLAQSKYEFPWEIIPLIALFVLFLSGVFQSEEFYRPILTECFDFCVLLLWATSVFVFIGRNYDLPKLIDIFLRYIGIISTVIGALGLFKFHLLLKGTNIEFLFAHGIYPGGTVLVGDYNSFTLGIIIGLVGLSAGVFGKFGSSGNAIQSIAFLILVLNVIFSFSRKGVLVLIILGILSSAFCIYGLIIRPHRYREQDQILKLLARNLIVSGLCIIVLVSAFTALPAPSWNVILEKLGYEGNVFRKEFTLIIYRHATIIAPQLTPQKVFPYLWGRKGYHMPKEIVGGGLPFRGTMLGSRTERWRYAVTMFNEEYTFSEKLFGGGFDYLVKYPKKFGIEEGFQYDYPHNSLFSSLLYSGVVGFIVYFMFLGMTFVFYIRYLKYEPRLFILFLILLLYSLVSGDSFISIPIFAIVCMFAYFIRYVGRVHFQK